MSPEGVESAIETYLESLKGQAKSAEAFYFGRIGEGIERLLELPEAVRERVDQLIWEKSGGEMLDPTDEKAAPLIVEAVLSSLEERMGFCG